MHMQRTLINSRQFSRAALRIGAMNLFDSALFIARRDDVKCNQELIRLRRRSALISFWLIAS